MLAALLLAILAAPAYGADPWAPLWTPDPSAVRRGAGHELSTRLRLRYPQEWRTERERRLALHVAGGRGRSRTEPKRNLIRTGAQGGLESVLGSLAQEAPHLLIYTSRQRPKSST